MTQDATATGSPGRADRAAGKRGAGRTPEAPGSLVGFVWRFSKREQIFLLALTALSFPLVYLSLEVPKIIVNQAISGTDFPKTIAGVTLEQIPFLLSLCFLFLGLVVLINGFKWLINVGIGMAGERMLRRLRYMLTDRMSRFPMTRLRSLRSGETIQSIMGEVEPLGGFLGEVAVTPIFQGGLLTVYVVFIFVQDFWLGLAAVAFYPVQTFLIPILQARIVRLNRARAANSRIVADQIGDAIELAPDIRSHGTVGWHLAQISGLLHTNTKLRSAIFRRKFTIKFINNFINQLTPFFFYSIGGYLVIIGELDFGALVAVLAAYKDLAGPWKQLLNYIQRLSDFSSRYRFVMEAFEVEGSLDRAQTEARRRAPLEGDLTVMGVAADPDTDLPAIARLALPAGGTLAIEGGQAGSREAVLRLLAGVDPPAQGRVSVGGTDLSQVPLACVGTTLALASDRPGLVRGTLRDNIAYGLFHEAPPLPEKPGPEMRERIREAAATGNLAVDPEGDWVDYAAAGVAGPEELDARILTLTAEFGLSSHLLAVALGRTLPPEQVARWADSLMAVRAAVAGRAAEIEDLIEHWDAERYNTNGSLFANLFYALPSEPAGSPAGHLDKPEVRRILQKSGGDRLLTDTGWIIAETLSSIAGAAGANSGILDRLGSFSRRDITDAAAIVEEAGGRGLKGVGRAGRSRLQGLAANFVEIRDQLDVLDVEAKARALEIRGRILPIARVSEGFIPFDRDVYNPGRTASDNILHARRRFDRRSAWDRIDGLIEESISALGLESEFIKLGLAAPIGETALPTLVVRRIGLVRCLLKRPRFLMLAGTADLHPGGESALLASIRHALPGAGVAFVPSSAEAAALADTVATIGADGRLGTGDP